MASNPATTADLGDRSLRTLTARELQVGSVLLDDAWGIVVSARPSIATRMESTPSATFTAVTISVLCAMVLRVLNNPDGKWEESGDDYSYRRDQAVSTGALYVSEAELSMLGTGSKAGEGAFSIRPDYAKVTVPRFGFDNQFGQLL